MLVKRITRLSNPRRTARKRNARKRLTPKQIKFFGTKAQRNALKRKRSNPKRRNSVAGAYRYYKRKLTGRGKFIRKTTSAERARGMGKYSQNPKRRRKVRKAAKNPIAHMLTFGLAGVNPKPRKKRRTKATMPATKKRRVRRRTTAKTNPRRRRRTVNVHHRRRRAIKAANPRRRRRNTRVIVKNSHRRRHHYRRNPSLFGQSNGFEVAKMVVGGLAGVTITKAVPNMLPSSMTSSPIMRVGTSVAVALLSGYLAGKFADKTLGDSIMFGGLMQAGSVALNSFLPSVGATIGLQGLGGGVGDLIAGSYPIPQNPIFPQYNPGYGGALPAPAPAAAASGAPMPSGVHGIFGSAF